MRFFIAGSLLSMVLTGCASQQQPATVTPLYAGPATPAPTAPEPNVAQQVLSRLHRYNQMGIELGQVAAINAASDEVKKLAAEIARNRSAFDARVIRMAKEDNIALVEPTPFSDADRQYMTFQNSVLAELRDLKGEAFDRAYLTTIVLHHADVLPILEDLAPKIIDQNMKSLVSNAIPVLQHEYARGLALLSQRYRAN